MQSIIKIAVRNLVRYKRRTLLTASLITTGVVFVVVYIAVSASFKNMIVGQITDSMLGHAQIHRKGYVASIENLPLNLTLNSDEFKQIENILKDNPDVEAYSPRLKFGGMFSNFVETTNIRLNGVYPEKENKTTPLLSGRITTGSYSLKRGEILIPELLASGMNIKPGDTAVIIATNHDGSVNGMQFTVSGVLSSVVGPGGRDGYIHFDDAVEILRMEKPEVCEIAIRVKSFSKLSAFEKSIKQSISNISKGGKQLYEVHTWEGLSPFVNIAKMIDVMTLSIRIMLIAIVLISIMNVMMMAVYERIREIGTIAAIGTLPEKILYMYVTEGFFLGVIGSVAGVSIGTVIIFIINIIKINFNFGMQQGLVLNASLSIPETIAIVLTVLAVSLAAGFYPAYKASKMEPVEALRHV
jgi:putative ABC transport system permease protein